MGTLHQQNVHFVLCASEVFCIKFKFSTFFSTFDNTIKIFKYAKLWKKEVYVIDALHQDQQQYDLDGMASFEKLLENPSLGNKT